MARPPIRLRNSWKSSCPSELRSNLFIMRSRTPGSFWFFLKAPNSVFMKIRNSALESLLLLPSLPACFWKTAIRDSMHRSVSIGLDTFAMSERRVARECKWGAVWPALGSGPGPQPLSLGLYSIRKATTWKSAYCLIL